MKVIVVSGGVISGLGKGITTSSLGRILKARGIPVTIVKIDPYLNVDAGTMNPYQHGEVFVLDDGTEADLDLGNYERFLGQSLNGSHNLTTGKIYRSVIEKERRGDYLGNTVQIIPHVTGEIKRTIREVAQSSGAEVVLVEVGGTVGDIESMPFLEALRELSYELGEGHMAFVHTTLVPVVGPVGEAKTKPTQHSVRELRAIGIRPTMIVARGPAPLSPDIKAKISLFCDVSPEAVISVPDQSVIYEVPLVLEAQGVGSYLTRLLGLPEREPDFTTWKAFLATHRRDASRLKIAMVGKYTELRDAYLSHIEAFHHVQGRLGASIHLQWYDSEDLPRNPGALGRIARSDGILVPGGFGSRGIEGKILAIELARTRHIPYLGVCYGFQMEAIEFARNVLALPAANTTEVDPHTPDPVVCLLEEQRATADLGGTMRLGAQRVLLEPSTRVAEAYGRTEIWERHRHRYEINPTYIERFREHGLVVSGRSVDGRVEALEIQDHPFFVGVQYHPEFLSRPEAPHPLYLELVRAALARKEVPAPLSPPRRLARELSELDGQVVRVAGHLEEYRALGGVAFGLVRDRSGTTQVTLKKGVTDPGLFEMLGTLPRESVVSVLGTVQKSTKARRGVELLPSAVEVVSTAEVPLPLGVVDKVGADLDTRLNHRVIDLRKPSVQHVFHLRAALLEGFRHAFTERSYVEVETPKLLRQGAEGGATLFPVQYFDQRAYLAQSPQLYKQMLMGAGFERVFEIGPAFRAEPSDTVRHITEFTSLDAEVAYLDGAEEVRAELEHIVVGSLRHAKKRLSAAENPLAAGIPEPHAPFARISFSEVERWLGRPGAQQDLGTEDEKRVGEIALKEHAAEFYFITDFPTAVKSHTFYAQRRDDDPSLTGYFDLDFKGLELASGGPREHRLEPLLRNIAEAGLRPEEFPGYLEAFRFGMPPHGGWGFGVDRLVWSLAGVPNIREARLFPRDRYRLDP